ncbi:hypothetical protein JOF56_009276 [Kibdelosporangium banguiense]|uniref:Uncharacterized protein n=1 Tax=Kibdelosporangium banguiense TaxID=1365924 RepID=A0ABS4TWV6_9PSEU|nr:hypothetical protein [Kibdelosporangium banguiense]MBP2328891.1 hypothetical protein [Kibdelosporangium banguiense]
MDAIPAWRKNTPSRDASLLNAGWPKSKVRKIRKGLDELAVRYEVKVSDNVKFPHSPNPFERSIRDHLVLNAEYLGLNSTLKEYLKTNGKKIPDFLPKGTKMDTVASKIT